ncbi:MAG: hypothetical protein K0Q87_410 [Neobacillus sp.]|nr:hypothetical protein [Neobacillus sp.]
MQKHHINYGVFCVHVCTSITPFTKKLLVNYLNLEYQGYVHLAFLA